MAGQVKRAQDDYLLSILQSTSEKDNLKIMNKPKRNRYQYNTWVKTFRGTKFAHLARPLARAGFFKNDKNEIRCIYCQFELPNNVSYEVGDDILAALGDSHNSNNCSYVQFMKSTTPKVFFGYDSLRYESERLETFINWPIKSISPFDLAENGFFYLRRGDYCACIFCGGYIGVWEIDDDDDVVVNVAAEHARYFPNCPFIKAGEEIKEEEVVVVGNIPMEHCVLLHYLTESVDFYSSPPPRLDYNDYQKIIDNKDDLKSWRVIGLIGISIKRAMTQSLFLRMAGNNNLNRLSGRIKTFNNNKPKLKTPFIRQLAEAGFYYTGLADHVTCFSCHLNFRNWESEDYPLKEHAIASPTCPFIRMRLSLKMINRYRESGLKKWAQYMSYDSSGIDNKKVLDVLPTLMDSDVIRQVLSLTCLYKYDDVFKTLYFKILRTGVPFFSVQSFRDEFNHHFRIQRPDANKNDDIVNLFSLPQPNYHTLLYCKGCSYCNFIKSYVICKKNDDNNDEIDEKKECKICYSNPATLIFLPCRHLISCASCADRILFINNRRECPMCRTRIESIIIPKNEIHISKKVVYFPCTHVINNDNYNCQTDTCETCHTIIGEKRVVKKKSKCILCVSCKKNPVEILLQICNHMVLCQRCFTNYKNKNCPSCDKKITSIITPITC